MKTLKIILMLIALFISVEGYSQYKPTYINEPEASRIIEMVSYNNLMSNDAKIMSRNRVREVSWYDSANASVVTTMKINRMGKVTNYSVNVPVWGNLVQKFTYDKSGKLTSMSETLNDTLRSVMKYKYKKGRLASAWQTYPKSSNLSYTFSYDNGRMSTITQDDNVYTISYDMNDNITSVKDKAGKSYTEVKYPESGFNFETPKLKIDVREKDGRMTSEYFQSTAYDAEHTSTFSYKKNGLIDYSMNSYKNFPAKKVLFDYKYYPRAKKKTTEEKTSTTETKK